MERNVAPTPPADSELHYILARVISEADTMVRPDPQIIEWAIAEIEKHFAASRAQLRAELETQLQLNDVPVVEARTVRVILDRVFGERDTKSNQTSSVI